MISNKCVALTALLVAAGANGVRAGRYEASMNRTGARDSLKSLAFWEDQRITGDGQLFAYLRSNDTLVRLRAVEVIGRIQDASDTERLIPMLDDADGRVRREAAFALGQIGSPLAAQPLIDRYTGATEPGRRRILEALGKIGGRPAVGLLQDSLHDFSASIRSEAALALARAADPSALSSLLVAARDPDPRVVWPVVYALEKTPSPRVGPVVAPLLSSDDPRVRAQAARTIGIQKYTAGIRALRKALRDDHLGVAVEAARALGRIGDEHSASALGEMLLSHASHHARRAAAEALGAIGSRRGEDALIQALMDESSGVRRSAVTALAACLGRGSEDFLREMGNDGDRRVRAAAIEGYGAAGLKSRVGFLSRIAAGDPDPMMRSAAIRGLATVGGDRSGAPLVAALGDTDWAVAAEAASALGKLDYPPSATALADAYRSRSSRQEGNVRLAALKSLSAIGDSTSRATCRDALRDPDPRFRRVAAEALEKAGVEIDSLFGDREMYRRSVDLSRRRKLSAPLGTVRARIKTGHGSVEMELFGDDAVQTVASFVHLAKAGFYNGLVFHRVVGNFVVQGGCPRGDGWGDAGYYIRSEFSQHRYERGTIGIAHDGKDTGGSQFFITLSAQHRLDGRYTAFGKVVSGMDVVERIDEGDAFRIEIIE